MTTNSGIWEYSLLTEGGPVSLLIPERWTSQEFDDWLASPAGAWARAAMQTKVRAVEVRSKRPPVRWEVVAVEDGA